MNRLVALAAVAGACLVASASSAQTAPLGLVVTDVTVVSPERAAPLQHAYVRIEEGRITELSGHPLKGTSQVDGRGKFLIPGLIDTHTHLGQGPAMLPPQRAAHPDLVALTDEQEPRSYLYFGFTTVLSLGNSTARSIERWNSLTVRPDAYFCGGTPLVGGYSFQGFAASPYFLFNADQAKTLPSSVDKAEHTPEAVVSRMASDGAICVKSYWESGFGRNAGTLPVPSVDMIRAMVASAHAHRMPVFLHANSKQAQQFGVQAGVDVIAHGMWNGHQSTPEKLDKGVEPILQQVLARRMGYQPTAQVIRGLRAMLDDRFWDDPLVMDVYPAKLIAWYRSPEGSWFRKNVLGDVSPNIFEPISSYGDVVTAYLARHNARLLFGTDTPSDSIYTNPPGLNGFYEMRNWKAAGISEEKLFHSLTIDNARVLHLDDRIGSVQRGKVANLLLLRANPLQSIGAYNTIETVFIHGRPIARSELSARSASSRK
jgi:imidazolonepropionase-like amidohydrolase